MIYRGPSFLAVVRLHARPVPPSPVIKLSLFLSLPLCRRPSLLTGEGGSGARSYDRKKAWASINRLILSGLWAHGIVAVAFAIKRKEQLRTEQLYATIHEALDIVKLGVFRTSG
jgi:hypothetical protein